MGGYFVRRDSSNLLYRRVLSRYVQMATASGVAQAVFPEGGLTRDGRLRPPKLGLLSYMVSAFDPNGPRDIVFVPVGINYDRVLEDRILTATAATRDGERPHFAVKPLALVCWFAKGIWHRIRGTWHRNGYACVSFGRPLSLRDYLRQRNTDMRTLPETERFAEIDQLGQRLMQEVGRVVPALPVSRVSTAILAAGKRGLTAVGAHVHIPRHDQEYAVDVGLRMLLLRHLVVAEGGVYRPQSGAAPLLAFYANAIAHLLPVPTR
jgi:glycerol-3-phosphate O-acyltransferase